MNLERVHDLDRLRAVRASGLLEMEPQEAFDRMTRLAVRALRAPAAFLSVVESDRDYYLSQCGFAEPLASTRELRGVTFCHYALESEGPLVIEDTRAHPVYRSVPTVESLGVAAYVGVPVRLPTGEAMGAICAIDVQPRAWTALEVETLEELAASAEREIALRAAGEHYRRLVETSPYGIFLLDGDGVVREANEALAELTGRPVSELLDAPLGAEVGEGARAEAARWAGGDGVAEGEFVVTRPDGTLRRAHVRARPVRVGGTSAGLHGVVRDVTEERERERLLRRSQRLASLGTLVSGVAHELNNPLTAVRGFAQLLALDATRAEDRETLGMMRRELDRMAKVVADLRTIAQSAVAPAAESEPVDLNDVVRHVLRLRDYSLVTGNVEVEQRLAPGLPVVLASRAELEQVVLNLVVNAEQAMASHPREGGHRLTVRSREEEERVVLEVADTGPGIPREHRERVFDPFFTTREAGEGMGLGLALVHGILTERGGEVRLSSRDGEGTTFRVDLPGRPAEAPAAAAPSPTRRPAATARRVLVVDDEAAIRTMLDRFLTRRGHRVAVAANAEEALLRLREERYDVVVSDLRMPGAGGGAVLDALTASDRGERLVLITGDAGSDAAQRAREQGVWPVLEKPLSLDEVAGLVETQ